MARTEAYISPEIVVWAMKRAEVDIDELADKLKQKKDTVEDWLNGTKSPTFRQAENLAKRLHIPFGYLFLDSLPDVEVPIPDLRTMSDEKPRRLDANSQDLIRDVFHKHDWYKEYLIEIGVGDLEFVGSQSIKNKPEICANAMAVALNRSGILADKTTRTHDEFLRSLMLAAEALGIWTMRSGIVGSNTHRPLSINQFRGFAIADKLLPLVFVNGQDATAAQIFTFAHELAHIWIGESGISNNEISQIRHDEKKIEKFCNSVAAEFLVPKSEFSSLWRQDVSLQVNAETIAKKFKVSTAVAARRAAELGKVSDEEFGEYFGQLRSFWESLKARKSGGGDFIKTLPIRNGRNFTNYVLRSAMQGDMLLRDAARLLHVKPNSIEKLYKAQAAT